MYEAMWRGHLVVCEWVVGVDWDVPCLSPSADKFCAVRKIKTIADFFGSLGPLQQLSQKNGVFFDMAHPPPSFFFPPRRLAPAQGTDPSKC